MRARSEGLDNRLLTPCLPWSVAKRYREFFVRLPELDQEGRVVRSEPEGRMVGEPAEAENLVRGLHGFVVNRRTGPRAGSTNADDEEEGAQSAYKADQKGWSDTVDDGSGGTKVCRFALPPSRTHPDSNRILLHWRLWVSGPLFLSLGLLHARPPVTPPLSSF